MDTNSKALLDRRQALPAVLAPEYHQAMLSTSTAATLAAKLREALTYANLSQAHVARECGVTKQAVQGWLKTGRIDKVKLLKFSEITGVPVESLLSDQATIHPVHAAPQPHTEPRTEPEITTSTVRSVLFPLQHNWPFGSFTLAEFMRLPDKDRAISEAFMAGLIAANRNKSTGTDDPH